MIGQTSYPAAIDTDAELIRVVDGVYGGALVLAEPVSATADALPVTARPGVLDRLPASGVVSVRDEHIGYAAKTAGALTGCADKRGLFQADGGTAPSAHPAGAPVEGNVVAAHRRVLKDAIVALETRLGAGPNPAQSGHVRASNGAWLTARDAFNSRDLNLIRAAADDRVELANGAAVVDPVRGLVLPGGLWLPNGVLALTDHFAGGNATQGSIGQLGWSFGAGSFAYLASERRRPGIVRLATTVTNVPAILTLGGVHALDRFDLAFVARVPVNDASTGVRFGLSLDWTVGAPGAGIYVEKIQTDTQWFGVARSGGAQTRTDPLAPAGAGWTAFRVRRVDAATVAFSVDGGPEALLSTNVPSAVVPAIGAHVYSTVAGARYFDLDWFGALVTDIGY